MNELTQDPRFPETVTFFIGPPGAPPNLVEAYRGAVELAESGDREELDEFLQVETNALEAMANGDEQDYFPIRDMLSSLVDEEIGSLETFVSVGFLHGHWTPILTIYLDRAADLDGESLGHLFGEEEGEVIAAILGLAFKAEWIQTIWSYPGTPIDLSSDE